MRTFSRLLNHVMTALVLAVMAMLPCTATADMIHTPFVGLPGANDNSLNSEEWLDKLNKKLQSLPFTQAWESDGATQNGFEPLWSAETNMADREAECDNSQLRRLPDGGYIGVYTCGGGNKILEGRIVRLSSTGEKLWETVLQDSLNTTADKVCQGEDGRFYVLGTTMRNGLTQSYVACVDNTGKQVYLNTMKDNMAIVKAVEVVAVGNETVVVYTTSTASYGGVKTLTARWIDASGNQLRDLHQTVSTTTNEYVSRLGDFLMVPMYSTEAFAINLKNGTIALHVTQENRSVFYNGCVNGDALYTLHKNASAVLVLTQYKIENGNLVEKWKCTTSQNNSGYDSFAFPLNNGRVLIYNKQRQGGPGMAIINQDGSKYQDKAEVNFGECNEAWGYAATQASDGTIYVFGMIGKGNTFALSILTTGEDLSNPQAVFYNNLDSGYTLYYSQYDRSYYADGQFVFSGYMRPMNFSDHGFTPLFGTYTVTDNNMRLLYKGVPGNIADVEPQNVAVDKDYNVYMSLGSAGIPMLVKYDSKGSVQWIKTLSTTKGTSFNPVVLSNGNVCAGSYSQEEGLEISCFTTTGQEVYRAVDESMLGVLGMVTNGVYAIESEQNSLVVAYSGYGIAEKRFMPSITKVDDKGTIKSKLITDFEKTTYVNGITKDANGNSYILGETLNSDNIGTPMILKVDANLQVMKAFAQGIDVRCPLYYGSVDKDGRIFVAGNTQYHGMIFIYDKDFNRIGYHIFDTSTSTQSTYGSLSLTSQGDALVSACYKNENNKRCGLILCYNNKAELQWKYEKKDEGSGSYFLYNAAQYGSNIIAAGYFTSPAGVQNYALELNSNQVLQKEYLFPQNKGYASYTFRNSYITNGNAYVTFTNMIGKARIGNLICFGDPATCGYVEEVYSSSSSDIIITNGTARLSDCATASWQVYTVAGTAVMNRYGDEIDLSQLQKGIYIVSARTANGLVTKKLVI